MMIRGILVGLGFRIGNSASWQLRGSLPPLVHRRTMRRDLVHALVRPGVEPLVLAALDVAPEGALAPPVAGSPRGSRPRPRPLRPGPARSPASGSPREPRPRLRPSRLGGLGPGPGRCAPALLGPARTHGSRAASSCAGRRTCRPPRVSSCLVRWITSDTRVRAMGRLLGAHRIGQPGCCRTGHTGQIVRSRQGPPGYRHAVRIGYPARRYETHRPAPRSATRFVFREPRHGTGPDPREEAAMDTPARFPSKSTAIAARVRGRGGGTWQWLWVSGGTAPSRPGRASGGRRRCGAGRTREKSGALTHRCSLTAGFGAGLTEQAVFERRRHAPAGAPSTGELP